MATKAKASASETESAPEAEQAEPNYALIYRNAVALVDELQASIDDLQRQRERLVNEREALSAPSRTDVAIADAEQRIADLAEAIQRNDLAIRLSEHDPVLVARRDQLITAHETVVAELATLRETAQREAVERETAAAELTQHIAALDEAMATVRQQLAQTADAAAQAHAQWGEREHAAVVADITAAQQRIQETDREHAMAQWQLVAAREAIAKRLARWPALAAQVTREFVPPPSPREDATTRLLTAWVAFLRAFEAEAPSVDQRILTSFAWTPTDILVLAGHRLPTGAMAAQAAMMDTSSAQARRDKRAGAEQAIIHYRQGKLPNGQPM